MKERERQMTEDFAARKPISADSIRWHFVLKFSKKNHLGRTNIIIIFGSRDNPIIVNNVARLLALYLMLMAQWCKIIHTRTKFIHVAIKSAVIFFFLFRFLDMTIFFMLVSFEACTRQWILSYAWLAVPNLIKSGFLLCVHIKFETYKNQSGERMYKTVYTAPSCRFIYDTLDKWRKKITFTVQISYSMWVCRRRSPLQMLCWMRSTRFLHKTNKRAFTHLLTKMKNVTQCISFRNVYCTLYFYRFIFL